VLNTSHQRRPRTSITPDNIAAVRDLIEGDRWLTVFEIVRSLVHISAMGVCSPS
jgi:hypothetical protein